MNSSSMPELGSEGVMEKQTQNVSATLKLIFQTKISINDKHVQLKLFQDHDFGTYC